MVQGKTGKLYSHIDGGKEVELRDLQVANKAVMMENFDAFVTDPRLKLAELQAHIAHLSRDDAYHLGEYRVLTTSGSSGRKGVFVFNRKEWSTAIAGYWRCGTFMGVRPRLPRWKMAIVSAGSHLFEDLFIAEAVDEKNRPVPDGVTKFQTW